MSPLSSDSERADLAVAIEAVLETQASENSAVDAVERISDDPPGWYVRLGGEAKEHYSVELHLGQRSLRFSSYFIPAPRMNEAAFFRHLLARNEKLYGMAFSVGAEDAVYLTGRLPNRLASDPDEIDRIIGSIYAYTEEFFPTAVRIGFIGDD